MLESRRDAGFANETLPELVRSLVGQRRVQPYALHRDGSVQDRIESFVNCSDRARRETVYDVVAPAWNLIRIFTLLGMSGVLGLGRLLESGRGLWAVFLYVHALRQARNVPNKRHAGR